MNYLFETYSKSELDYKQDTRGYGEVIVRAWA